MPTPPPPKEHQFKPGAEWRGNAGGRPKKQLTDRAAALLECTSLNGKALPNGSTVADMILLAWVKKAMQGDAAARRDFLDRLEGKVPERSTDGGVAADTEALREFLAE